MTRATKPRPKSTNGAPVNGQRIAAWDPPTAEEAETTELAKDRNCCDVLTHLRRMEGKRSWMQTRDAHAEESGLSPADRKRPGDGKRRGRPPKGSKGPGVPLNAREIEFHPDEQEDAA